MSMNARLRGLFVVTLVLGFMGLLGNMEMLRAAPKFVDEDESARTLEGRPAADFALKTLDGEVVSLKALRGKVVFLDFWASWCGPCRRSMPHIEDMYKSYKKQGFQVIGVNVDKDEAKARQFLRKINVSYPIALDSNAKLMGEYRVQSMPTAFLIDKKGIIRHRIVGFSDKIAAETKTKIEALLK